MAKPTLVLVPGIWEGTSVFDVVANSLRAHGYNTVYAPLASTGHASPGNPTLLDDVQHIRNVIKPLVEEDKEVIVVGHSAGGPLGAAATKDLTLKERTEAGKSGGVKKFVFLSAGLVPAGWRHPEVLDFYDIQVRRRLFLLLLIPAARRQPKKRDRNSFRVLKLSYHREVNSAAKIP
jgi:pimeloyl-ACP methyl ester carboxylesterase